MPTTTATGLAARFRRVRALTDALTAPLTGEDQVVQSFPLASPAKWHRAHTTWFFETFLLGPAGVPPVDPAYGYLFNSYYDAIGDRLARPSRGLLSRPSADEITAYRRAVDHHLAALLDRLDDEALRALTPTLELGLAHEEQHQELILTDILHAFASHPLGPAYRADDVQPPGPAPASAPLTWHPFAGGVVELGAPQGGFAFDNERPRHRAFLEPFALASRPITVSEVRAFIAAGGYHTPSLWLSEGYATARASGWEAPLHAAVDGGAYRAFTLRGWRTPADDEPAAHLSFWEAEALARFLGARLPTEAEWEHAALASTADPRAGNQLDAAAPLHPRAGTAAASPGQLFGDVWEWTRSAYEPYPGFTAAAGAIGEYNGKFMAQQQVLRGGSCLTPRGHLRPSYRNFWHPDTRFQLSGARLARTP
jgi:ergothioneine biosynthesis protein EgtB